MHYDDKCPRTVTSASNDSSAFYDPSDNQDSGRLFLRQKEWEQKSFFQDY